MRSLFERSLSTLTDFAVCLPELVLRQTAAPFDRAPRRYDPRALASEPFLHLLNGLDRAAYGPLGLEMPHWAMYDCGELPGIVAGYGRPAGELPGHVRELLGVPPDYAGLVPLSMAILIPRTTAEDWLCYSLCSINEIAPGAAPARLRLLTLATVLARLRMGELWGIQQWRSTNLKQISRLGPLRLLSAYTPAHTQWATLTYRVPVRGQSPAALLANARVAWAIPTMLLDCDDMEALMALQERVEAGEPVWVVGSPQVVGDRTLFPVKVGRPGEEEP